MVKRMEAGSVNTTSNSEAQRRRKVVYWNYQYKEERRWATTQHQLTGSSQHPTERFRDMATATRKETDDGFERFKNSKNETRRTAALIVRDSREENCSIRETCMDAHRAKKKIEKRKKNVSEKRAELGSGKGRKNNYYSLKQYLHKNNDVSRRKEWGKPRSASATRNKQTRANIQWFCFLCNSRPKDSAMNSALNHKAPCAARREIKKRLYGTQSKNNKLHSTTNTTIKEPTSGFKKIVHRTSSNHPKVLRTPK